MTRVLYLLFILSGAAGLIYESIWTRYLGLFVGHDAYAQIIVLVIFLGGMSAGAMMVSRHSERLTDPLKGYALIELAVGLIGLVFHEIYQWSTNFAYTSIYPMLAGTPMLVVAKWTIASALILPQSVLLGATFPLMSAGVLRLRRGRTGQSLSLLYFANSLGAAVGVLVAGFYLVGLAGLPGTLLVAAMLNLVGGAGHVPGGGSRPPEEPGRSRGHSARRRPPAPDYPGRASAQALAPLLLFTSFGTAVASFIYEIDWIRMLALVLGGATHAFELMLSAFILGLALGALWVRSRIDRFRNPIRTLGIVQWIMGLMALATLPVYVASFDWIATLMTTFARTDLGYVGFTAARYALCLAIMLPATFCAGMTLPLITRTLIRVRRRRGGHRPGVRLEHAGLDRRRGRGRHGAAAADRREGDAGGGRRDRHGHRRRCWCSRSTDRRVGLRLAGPPATAARGRPRPRHRRGLRRRDHPGRAGAAAARRAACTATG